MKTPRVSAAALSIARGALAGPCLLLGQPAQAQSEIAPPSSAQFPSTATSDATVVAAGDPASQDGSDDVASSDIVVTALRTNVRLGEVPAAVTVLNDTQITSRGLTSLQQLTAVIPGFAIYSGPIAPTASIRGIGTSTAVQSFDGTVGLFVDGIFAPRGRDLPVALFDIADLQAVKGTQASVLGKNTSVGAVVIRSRRPGRQFGFDAIGSYEFNFNSVVLSGGVDLPLAPNLFARAAGRIRREEGYVRNDLTGRRGGGSHSDDLRLSLLWDAAPGVEAYAYYQYSNILTDLSAFEIATPGRQIVRSQPFAPNVTLDGSLDYHAAQSDPAFLQDRSFEGSRNHRAVLEFDVDVGGGTLTSLTGYTRSTPTRAFLDGDYLPGSFISQVSLQNSEQYSTELRFASDQARAFRYLGGALLYYNHFIYNSSTYENEPTLTCATATVKCGASYEGFDQKTRTMSLFGQMQWTPVRWFDLTGGLRYTNERKAATYETYYIVDYVAPDGRTRYLAPNPAFVAARGGPQIAPTTLRREEEPLDYSVSGLIHATDRLNLYASYGKGTKSGGFQAAARTTLNNVVYDTEVARSAEVGIKWSLPRAHLYLSGFRMNVDGFQDALFNGLRFVLVQYPLRAEGFELDAAISPLPGLDLGLQATYSDVTRRDTGRRAARSPEWSGTGHVSYTGALNDRFSLTGAADLNFRSSYLISYIAFVPTQPRPSQKLDLRVALEDRDKGWTLSLIGRNVTNERTLNFAFPASVSLANAPPNFGTIGSLDQPRTVLMQVSIRR